MRSVLALVAGYGAMALLIGVKFAMLQRWRPEAFTSVPWLVGIVATDAVSAAIGGFALAAVAGGAPLWHAAALVSILLPLGIWHAHRNAGREPRWFQVAVQAGCAIGIPAGAWLFASTLT